MWEFSLFENSTKDTWSYEQNAGSVACLLLYHHYDCSQIRHRVSHMVLVTRGTVSKMHHEMIWNQLPIKAHPFEKLTLGFEQFFTMVLFEDLVVIEIIPYISLDKTSRLWKKGLGFVQEEENFAHCSWEICDATRGTMQGKVHAKMKKI